MDWMDWKKIDWEIDWKEINEGALRVWPVFVAICLVFIIIKVYPLLSLFLLFGGSIIMAILDILANQEKDSKSK